MKIYFAASIRGGRDMAHVYPGIVKILKDAGHNVLSEMFASQEIDADKGSDADKTAEYIYKRDIEWLKEADIVVAETTQPSLGVGYELAKADEYGTDAICLFFREDESKKVSAMIEASPNVTTIYYKSLEELEQKLPKLLQ